ncbi:hypothetical protein GVO57_10550 [Sphingomonas changnyeongensis]|uniref:Uncharacterized protein n=1 Tax=Sphingomonas changnyeongensis TaxID=2698679 RepID=A0A7Z2NWL3_9SPHN|nr:hypothetical protein [Sphingomonas changnyeongensis]QHL91176.1 hypothetical protein GVO57_10550 [Sphingomonas changnyeongensis]
MGALMTPAESDTRRRSLGLPVDETTSLCGLQDRTVKRWQSGYSSIPTDAAAALDQLEAAMSKAVEQAVALAADHVARGPVVLWRHRTQADQDRRPHAATFPSGTHAMMIARAADALAAEGMDVSNQWAHDNDCDSSETDHQSL